MTDERERMSWDDLGAGARVESFRGRRGWHVVFHYRVEVEGEPTGPEAAWFAPDNLPRTAHGSWERKAVERVLSEPVAA
jgi:hypothetical protein